MTRPLLWWLPLSHYNEKAAWYLDARELPHTRRAIPPFVHSGVALALTRGRSFTFPIMRVDGRIVAGSAPIVAALEARDGPSGLLPADPAQRARVLELEAFFDAGAGVDARFTLHHHNLQDDVAVDALVASVLPGLAGRPGTRAAVRATMRARLGVGGDAAAGAQAWRGVVTTFDRIESELRRGAGDHLVGDTFTLADLTGAALLYPLVLPPEGPQGIVHSGKLVDLMATVADRPAYRWVLRTYREHRGPLRLARGW